MKNFLLSQLVILSAGMLTLITLLKSNYYVLFMPRIKVLYLEGTEYCFTTLIFYLILIYVVLYVVSVVERVTYQKAILMHKIINNICPDYLKKNFFSFII